MTSPPGPSVAYVVTHHPRLSATFVENEIAALERRGLRIVPVAINAPAPGERDRPGAAAEIARTTYLKGTPIRRIAASLARALRRSPRAVAALFATSMRTAGTDLRALVWRAFHAVEAVLVWDRCQAAGVRHLHAHFAQLPSTLAWLATELGNRLDGAGEWTFSYTVHGPFELEDERAALVAPKVAAATFVVAVSDFTASQLKRSARPEDWHRIHVLRCGLPLERFPFRPRSERTQPARVVTVARLSAEKGHLELIDALDTVRRRGIEVEAEIIGDGPLRSLIEQRIAELGLTQCVRLAGAVEPGGIAARLGASDVFCLPSFSEGIPVSVMEAMAAGIPVIATSVGGIPELVRDGESGCLVPPGRADAIADALELLLTKDETRAALVLGGRRAVEADHDERRTIGPLADLLIAATHARGVGHAA